MFTGRLRSVDEAAVEIDRLDRRLRVLEQHLEFSRVGGSPDADIESHQRMKVWYDREAGKLKIDDDGSIISFTKD